MIKLTLSLIVLIITYFLIFTNRRIRTTSAFFGAILTIVLGLITFDKAISYIDFNKLGIIIGMMIFTIIAKESGIFQYLALKVIKYSKGNPLILLISEIIFANIGGLATYIGTPANIMIGSAAKLNFHDFIYHTTPISIILILFNVFYFVILFKNSFKKNDAQNDIILHLNKIDERKAITNLPLFKNSLLILGITTISSFFSHLINLDLSIVYLLGAIILLFVSHDKPDEIYAQIDWRIIFFLIGLNILAGTLEENGLIEIVSSKLLNLAKGNINFLSFTILGISTFTSSFFDNIPIIALAIPVIENISRHIGSSVTILWWALALGANIGANGTLIGTASNLIVADIAEKNKQPIPFWYFVKIALPLVIFNLVIASIYFYLRYLS